MSSPDRGQLRQPSIRRCSACSAFTSDTFSLYITSRGLSLRSSAHFEGNSRPGPWTLRKALGGEGELRQDAAPRAGGPEEQMRERLEAPQERMPVVFPPSSHKWKTLPQHPSAVGRRKNVPCRSARQRRSCKRWTWWARETLQRSKYGSTSSRTSCCSVARVVTILSLTSTEAVGGAEVLWIGGAQKAICR